MRILIFALPLPDAVFLKTNCAIHNQGSNGYIETEHLQVPMLQNTELPFMPAVHSIAEYN